MSSTRARFASDSASCSSARRRRRSCRRTPATSSNSGRRSSGRSASAWSTMPCPMNRKALSARCAASSRSTRSRSRIRLLVEQVVVLTRAVQAPAELEDLVLDRKESVGVVEDERDVGHAVGRPLLRARPDDVLSLARAERTALLPERPAQGIREIALARAVGADDGADARPELDVRPFSKRLEALEPKREQPWRGRPIGRVMPAIPPDPACAVARRAAALERLGGRGRLGRSPRRAFAHPEHLAADPDLDPERLLVVGPGRVEQAVDRADRRCAAGCTPAAGSWGSSATRSAGRRRSRGRPARSASRGPGRSRGRGRGRRLAPRTSRRGATAGGGRCAAASPSPRSSDAPRSMRPASRARPVVDTMAARRADRKPSSSSGWRAYRASEIARLTTASPRNSRRSLWPCGIADARGASWSGRAPGRAGRVADREAEPGGEGSAGSHARGPVGVLGRVARTSARRCSRRRPGRSGSSPRPRRRSPSRTPLRGS